MVNPECGPSSRRTPGSSAVAVAREPILLCRFFLWVSRDLPALPGPGFRPLSRPSYFLLLTQKKCNQRKGSKQRCVSLAL